MRADFPTSRGNRGFSPLVFVAVVTLSVFGAALPAAAAKGGNTNSGSCKPRTACATTDSTAPSIAISQPSGGSTVSGTVSIAGTSADNVAVSSVEISLDGGAYQPASGTTSWSRSIDTTILADGSHTVTARAADASGNVAKDAVTFTVSNPAQSPADTQAPTVAISQPAAGSTVSGTISVTGTASDDTQLQRVEVRVDTGAWTNASGTTTWAKGVDTTAFGDGAHTLTARATDGAGNVSTISRTLTFANAPVDPPPSGSITTSDEVLTNASISWNPVLVGRGRAAELGSLSFVLYVEEFGQQPWVHVRDASSGAVSNVRLPVESVKGQEWTDARYVVTPSRVLWILSGSGPVYLRKYQLSNEPLPSSATLLSTRTFGDSDSRTGELIQSASGALIGVWHQQGSTGPQGMTAFRLDSGTVTTARLDFMPSRASKQALAQNPADNSLWLFNIPDGWGRIGAAHLTETSAGLRVDWTDAYYIDQAKYGTSGPDPENADIVAAPDPSTGTIAIAYQNNVRRIFSTSPVVTGAHVTVARVPVSGAPTFTSLPIYVERISRLALVVRGSATWLAYRPIDQSTMTFDHLHLSRYAAGSWSTPKTLGRLSTPYERLAFGTSRVEITARYSDGKLHRTHAQ